MKEEDVREKEGREETQLNPPTAMFLIERGLLLDISPF